MKKIVLIIVLSILLIGCSNKKYQIINYEYTNSNYIDEGIEEKELLLKSYEEYKKLISKYNFNDEIVKEDFDKYDFIVVFDNNACDSEREIGSIRYYEDNTLEIIFNVHNVCGLCAPHTDVYFYRIDKVGDNVKINVRYKRLKDEVCDPTVSYKPILYIYPNEDMYINVKMEKDNNIITSYPKYKNGWNVYVNKDGNIYYNGREYYGLYWDEYNDNNADFSEGFYVNGEGAIKFLEEKLDIIGLTNREADEFIMYWLPILENNEHNLVYFELTEEREKNNNLIIDPKPDSMLRINMHVKKINNIINIKEQELEKFNRIGYTVIEWGGTIHKEG